MHVRELHLVAPGSSPALGSIDPSRTPGLSGPKEQERAAAETLHAENVSALQKLQYRLWAEGARSVLVVLQAMDAGGKDGAIRHVFGPLNPQGVRVAGFKKPTEEEAAHDFLWRVHKHAPAQGYITVFNRSHYEDVLVPRVHGLVERPAIERRYGQIVSFEALLSDAGTRVLKFFLHISRDEQKRRLQARLDDPEKRWKFNEGDLDERAQWDRYMGAYEAAIARCGTENSPWFVIPADAKWYRNWAISSILRLELEGMDPRPPAAAFDPSGFRID